METLKQRVDRTTSSASFSAARKVTVVAFCFVCMVTAFSHAFPTLPGFTSWRAQTSASTRTLGINQQWRMFTAKSALAIPTKISLVYKDGKSKTVVVRREQVSMSRSAENRFAETTFWSPGSVVVGAYLQASCERYAEKDNPVTAITMLQAKMVIPQTPDEEVSPDSLQYQSVRYVTCQSK